ncbi:MAG TPA: GAF domain-containing protein [Gemmatimonadaceae bacterium]|nr:GAF domain-containing protein [Gemmatimonadaceae bacterium]
MSAPARYALDKEDLQALLDTAGELNSMETLNEVLTNILKLAGSLCNSRAGSVILHDQERNDLYFAAATGPASEKLAGIRIPLGKGKASEVFLTRIPLVEDHVTDYYGVVDEKTEFVTRSMICIPLTQGEKTFGVMQILNKGGGTEPYTDRDLELLTRFGAQATVAIRNATLFEQMLASSGLYANPEVRQGLIKSLTNSGRSAIKDRFTVLFIDMRGFSQLCNIVTNPTKIQSVLSDYVLMIGAVVLRNEGIVNNVMGDGVMAIFRGDAAADNAVKTALDAIDGFERLKLSWKGVSRFNLDFLDIGAGITTDDETILGTIGDDRFRDFTVIGPGVNLAAALVKSARDGHRLVCDTSTYTSISDRGLASVEGPIQFRIEKRGPLMGVGYDVYYLKRFEKPADAALESKASERYDIFFSYRREGGSDVARGLQQALKDEFSIFLDVDRMPSGHFDTALFKTIESSPNFVVFLSPGSLDRCSDPEDWLRKEIGHAIATKRNIVPISLPGFTFPDPKKLADDIADVTRHDVVEYSHRYFYAMIDKLKEHLTQPE